MASSSSSSSSGPPMPAYVVPLSTQQCVYTSQYCEENAWKLAHQLLKRLDPANAPAAGELPESPEAAATAAATSTGLLESVYPSLTSDQVFVVFISNTFSSVRLFAQRSGDAKQDGQVWWDYHVVVLVKPQSGRVRTLCTCGTETPLPGQAATSCPCLGWIYDADTTLPFPCSLDAYARRAFRAHLSDLPASVRPGSAAALPSSMASALRRRNERLFRVVGASDFLANFASDRSHMLAPVQLLSSLRGHAEGVMPSEDEHPSRREVQQERATRAAEKASWQASPLRDRIRSEEEEDAAAEWNARSIQAEYLAPPPVYPPIRTAASRHNLDEYRLFTYPDSGRGVVMNQDEFLDFFHVQLPAKVQPTKQQRRR